MADKKYKSGGGSTMGGTGLANLNIGQTLLKMIITRAEKIATENGWSEGERANRPNLSATVRELLQIGFAVLELFGDDWKDQLKVQAQPRWAKELLDNQEAIKIKLQNINAVEVSVAQDNTTDDDMNFDGMIE